MRDTQRQRRDRLLHREPRPDGRAHRRLDHRRPGDDADRPRVPAAARHRASAIIREVGVDTGGCNIQFAVNPRRRPGHRHRDEPAGLALLARWRPRPPASRSPRSPPRSPIGYTLDEIPNDITEKTPASFEPTLDYVVVKVPRFAFEKFPAADPHADHAHEVGRRGDGDRPQLHRGAAEGAALAGEEGRGRSTGASERAELDKDALLEEAAGPARRPDQRRSWRRSAPAPRPRRSSTPPKIDPWFVDQLLPDQRDRRRGRRAPTSSTPELLRRGQAARLLRRPDRRDPRADARTSSAGCGTRSASARSTRPSTPAPPSSPRATPYHYSSYDEETEVAPRDEAGGDHPRLRAQPDRPGHRVRLLLRARLVRAAATPATRP